MRYVELYNGLYDAPRDELARRVAGIIKRARRRGRGVAWRTITNTATFIATQHKAEAVRNDACLGRSLHEALHHKRLREATAARVIQRAVVRFLWDPRHVLGQRAILAWTKMFS